jgi:hypothetical protein
MARGLGTGFILAAILAPLLVPAAVYAALALGAGLGVAGTAEALVDQATGQRQNLLSASLLGLVPALLLLAVLRLIRRFDAENTWRAAAGWGGLLGILLILIWANHEVWPHFLPGRTFPGWPHGIELVIAPLFFAPVAMLIGGTVAGILARRALPRP